MTRFASFGGELGTWVMDFNIWCIFLGISAFYTVGSTPHSLGIYKETALLLGFAVQRLPVCLSYGWSSL